MHQLAGQSLVLLPEELPENAILVARSMSPAALLDYDRSRLRGLVLEEGGASSHVAIVARALAIPAVSDVPNITEIVEHGDAIIVDGDSGEVYLRPPPDVEAAYAERARMRARKQAQYRALRDVPTVSLDGVRIGLHMNAGLLVDMPHLAETGAESIGLFRTELQFMLASRFPRPGVQEQLYRTILDAAGDRPVTFRTLDIGGDKLLPYMKGFEEENPALGWRALRIGLDRPALLRMQLRAFIRAAAGARPAGHGAHGLDRRRVQADARPVRSGARLEREPWPRNRRPRQSSASWSRCRRCCGSSTRSRPPPTFSRSARTT